MAAFLILYVACILFELFPASDPCKWLPRKNFCRLPAVFCLQRMCAVFADIAVFEKRYKPLDFGSIDHHNFLACPLGQFTRNYTQTVKRAADNKRRYAPGWVHSTCLLRGFPKGAAPHLAHDFAEQSVVCYTLCRRCPENTVAAGEGKGI